MKKICLTIVIALFVCTAATAQDTATVYRSVFGDSVTEWYLFTMREYNCGGSAWTNHWSINNNDTVTIDGNVYQKAIRTWNVYSDINHDTMYIRESTVHDKLYVRYQSGSTGILTPEILVMNLDLAVGDTLSTDNWSLVNPLRNINDYHIRNDLEYWTLPTITIDSIYYVDGAKYLVTDYCVELGLSAMEHPYNPDTLKFIEGIGPTLGVHYPLWPKCILCNILCGFKDAICTYHHRYVESDTCALNFGLSAIESVKWSHVKVWPNPVADRMTLSGLPDGGAVLTIFDFYGKPVIVTKPNVVGGSCEIDVATLTPGFYFIMLSDMKHQTLKFIKL